LIPENQQKHVSGVRMLHAQHQPDGMNLTVTPERPDGAGPTPQDTLRLSAARYHPCSENTTINDVTCMLPAQVEVDWI